MKHRKLLTALMMLVLLSSAMPAMVIGADYFHPQNSCCTSIEVVEAGRIDVALHDGCCASLLPGCDGTETIPFGSGCFFCPHAFMHFFPGTWHFSIAGNNICDFHEYFLAETCSQCGRVAVLWTSGWGPGCGQPVW